MRNIGLREGRVARCSRNIGLREGRVARCARNIGLREGRVARCARNIGLRDGRGPQCGRDIEVRKGRGAGCEPGICSPDAMRTLSWDDGTLFFDDPNAYWGDPSYVLEPGDPGYVVPAPPPGTQSASTKGKHSMSSNATPANRAILTALARSIYAGQLTHAASVGLLHHLAPGMKAATEKLEGDPAAAPGSAANKGGQLLYRDCVDMTGDAETALKDFSDGAVKTWLDGYRTILQGIHGKKADDGWVAAGFVPGSTSVPRTHAERQTLLGAARAYLAAHPTYEASLPQPVGTPLAITAAQALGWQTQMQTARTLVDTRTAEQATCKAVRDGDVDALFAEVSATIIELRGLLQDNDPRWEIFGLNVPANPSAPLGVSTLTVTAAGAGRELVAWSYAARADYYRLYLKRVGTDAQALNVADPRDLEHTLKNLTPGTTIEVYVVPTNGGGGGAASPTVSKVVGA